MLISDPLYGDFNITEPVFLELINSLALQRTKGISQFGPPAEFYHLPVFSRYEHNVGTMLLLKKLGAGTEEQIAGLLHDVSHTAFSHVIDWLWGDSTKENFQDNHHLPVLLRFGVDKILAKHGFDVYRIANFENFPLLDAPAPHLCADRLDYSLREFDFWFNPEIVKECVSGLVLAGGRIIYNNVPAAKKFAMEYMRLNREHWAGFEAASRYHQLTLILKEALDKKIIEKDDLWHDDRFVIDKLYASGDNGIISKLERMKEKKTSVRFGIVRSKKFRYVDPDIAHDGKIIPLSALDQEYGKILAEEKTTALAGIEI